MADVVANMSHWDFFIVTLAGFAIPYYLSSWAAYLLLVRSGRFALVQNKPYRPGQIRLEIKRSAISILMFSLLSVVLCEALRRGWVHILFEFHGPVFLLEVVALFFWNEIHFFTIHRLLHLKPFYKIHSHHHFSHVPSPFSGYSFHWIEGFLLGTVMPLVMIFHNFEFASLMMLPVMSLILNLSGHSNIDFFPSKPLRSLWSFSKRHSLHHQNPNGNYGFFLPFFDRIFNTANTAKNDESLRPTK